MPQKFKGSKINLGDELNAQLADFCTANYRAPAIEVIKEAIKDHLERRLKNPEMKARYEQARKTRLGLPEKIVKLADKKD